MCASCSQLSVKCYQSTVESPLYPAQCVEMCAAQSYAQFIEATDWKHIPEGFVELILRPFEFFSWFKILIKTWLVWNVPNLMPILSHIFKL